MKKKKAKKASVSWKNRIVGQGLENPAKLLANPKNWRIHPQVQGEALQEMLDKVGWVQQIIKNKRTGHLIDGHLRCQLAVKRDEKTVPVVYIDVSSADEDLILAALDPIAGLAVPDAAKLGSLLAELNLPDSSTLRTMMQNLITDEELASIAQDPSTGSLLALAKVTIADPAHKVVHRDVWEVGRHLLIVADVLREWAMWTPLLAGHDTIFCPYPGPFVPLTEAGDSHTLVMVQPETYIAGHILDQYAAVHGDGSVKKRAA